jgi:hypothetical protein
MELIPEINKIYTLHCANKLLPENINITAVLPTVA